MKKYMKPIMDSEVFVTNEFIGACSDSALACLNMNNATGVYVDTNENGTYDQGIDLSYTKYAWGKQNDCDTDGDSTAGKHKLTQEQIDAADRVFVVTTTGGHHGQQTTTTVTEAIVVTTTLSNSPHFISIKTANHS